VIRALGSLLGAVAIPLVIAYAIYLLREPLGKFVGALAAKIKDVEEASVERSKEGTTKFTVRAKVEDASSKQKVLAGRIDSAKRPRASAQLPPPSQPRQRRRG
jgi:hypothetical protein